MIVSVLDNATFTHFRIRKAQTIHGAMVVRLTVD